MNYKKERNKKDEAAKWWWKEPLEKRKRLAEQYFQVEFDMFGFHYINTSNCLIADIFEQEGVESSSSSSRMASN